MTIVSNGVDRMVQQYLSTALWASNDNRVDPEGYGVPLDDSYEVEDFTAEAQDIAFSVCQKFVIDNADDLGRLGELTNGAYDFEDVGHDLWLSRNGHGAGFFDRYLEFGRDPRIKEVFDRLQAAAEKLGETYVDSIGDGTVDFY